MRWQDTHITCFDFCTGSGAVFKHCSEIEQATLLEQSGSSEEFAELDLGEDDDIDSLGSDSSEDEPIQLAELDDQMAIDVELLEGIVDVDAASDNVFLRTENLLALTAVITDSLVRYEYNEHRLVSYMFNVMGVLD